MLVRENTTNRFFEIHFYSNQHGEPYDQRSAIDWTADFFCFPESDKCFDDELGHVAYSVDSVRYLVESMDDCISEEREQGHETDGRLYYDVREVTHSDDLLVLLGLHKWRSPDKRILVLFGLRDGFDMRPYSDPESYDTAQLIEIMEGLRSGVDVSQYDDPERYDWAQMQIVRTGLEAGIDVSQYNDPERYDVVQMMQIAAKLLEVEGE